MKARKKGTSGIQQPQPNSNAICKLTDEEKEAIIDRLEDSAKDSNNPAVVPRLGLMGGVFILLVQPLGVMLAAGAAAPFLLALIHNLVKAGKQDEYIERTGNFAHALTEIELVRLTKVTSREEVVDMIQEAQEDGQTLSVAAKRYLERAGVQVSTTIDAFFKEVESSERQVIGGDADGDSTEAVGALTRLGLSPAGPTLNVASTPSSAPIASEGYRRTLTRQDIYDFLANELTLIWGKAGSAKTTCVTAISHHAAANGYRVMVGDPHYKLGAWPGLKVFKTHEDCNDMLEFVLNECADRYRLRREEGKDEDDFKPWLVVLEEFTNWAKKCNNSAAFLESAIQDFRKANIRVLMVSHARTLSGIGGAKGFSEAIHNGCIELNLLAEPIETDKGRKSRPTGQGILREYNGPEERVNVPDFRNAANANFEDQSGFEFEQESKTVSSSSSAEDFNQHQEQEPKLIPGTNRSYERLQAEILKVLKENPDKNFLVKQLVRFEESAKRNLLVCPAKELCQKLAEKDPTHYIYRPAPGDFASICYQENPMTM